MTVPYVFCQEGGDLLLLALTFVDFHLVGCYIGLMVAVKFINNHPDHFNNDFLLRITIRYWGSGCLARRRGLRESLPLEARLH